MLTLNPSSKATLLLICILFCGCSENPGTWSQDKLHAKITEKLELVDAELQPVEGGGFKGSGTRADGETVTFTISQDPGAHKMSWEAEGDRGFVEEGFYELK